MTMPRFPESSAADRVVAALLECRKALAKAEELAEAWRVADAKREAERQSAPHKLPEGLYHCTKHGLDINFPYRHDSDVSPCESCVFIAPLAEPQT